KMVRPRNADEEVLAEIWRQVLGLKEVSVEENFFALGGDSILSIQIVARANQAGLKLTPKDVFRHQTIAGLAAASAAAGEPQQVKAEQGLLSGPAPLTPIQHYFFAQQLPEPEHFNQSLLLRVHERLQLEQLQGAVSAVVAQHDALRLQFARTEQGWEQSYGEVYVPVEVVEAKDAAALTTACERVQRSLRLESGGLLRVVLFETGAEQRLLLVAHHLVVDGVSWRIIVEDLGRALAQLQSGEQVRLGRKTSSYRNWGERLVAYAESDTLQAEQGYWEELAPYGAGELPVDERGGENTIATSRSVARQLEVAETRALLQEVPAAYRTQINEVLLTGLVEAVGGWSGGRQLLVDLEGHGRHDELFAELDLTRTVGWFTNVYPVWLDLAGK
ncbi:MAG TPA: condensation domain-containing protein, partial [Pyrinomonadaceae bacterium]